MDTDLSFISNEENQTLKERFEVLIKDTSFFDCLVGYFYTSGFHAIYQSLEHTEKIRILIGISTSRRTLDLMEKASRAGQQTFGFSHAKLYISAFKEGDRDMGRVITGSSNFTRSGLVDNLEFNVELKNRSDYEFAINKFDELWNNAVDVSEKYIQTIQTKTWLSQNISPYQLYLKFLYEYFKDELSRTDELFVKYLPQEFMRLEYQEQAVLNDKKQLPEYGGVFISDVWG